ncbi:M64 family metallopeptidase [Acidobacteriota bacterium]
MKSYRALILLAFFCTLPVCSQSPGMFSDYFINETMRIDYFHVGDKNREDITIDRVYRQGAWAGNPNSLIDEFNNGRYYIKVYDQAAGKLIFSKGFDNYFGEYKTTDEAASGRKRTYHESALIPYPKKKIRFVIENRDRQNQLHPIFEKVIDPGSIEINNEALTEGIKVFSLLKNGNPHHKVDLVFIAEGYTEAEEKKLEKHLHAAADILFKLEPYKKNKKKFNLYGVFKPSQESGCDEPGRGIYRNTAVHASFNSLGSSRYLLTEGNKELRDLAAHVPYDALIIMVNNDRYGGGGIYNSFCVFTAGSTAREYLLLHEFGHSFTGLADEYYSSSVAYNEFYPRGIEPVESNITALLDPNRLKWKEHVSEGIELPSKWRKEAFEKFAMEYQAKRAELNREIAGLQRSGAAKTEIEKLKNRLAILKGKNAQKTDAFLRESPFFGKVGAFEGAGYTAKGLYRPMVDCIMFSVGTKPYCTVCEAAVSRVIDHYTK